MGVVDRPDRRAIHELERARARRPPRTAPTTARPAASRLGKNAIRVCLGAAPAEPERRLGDDRRACPGCRRRAGQAVAGDVLDVPAAEPDDRPVGQDDLQAERPSRGSRRTSRSTARRRSCRGCRRSCRSRSWPGPAVEQALARDGLLEVGVDDAGLGHHHEVRAIDLEDPVHPGERDREPALDPDGAPASPVPAPRGTIGTRAPPPAGRARRPRPSASAGRPRREAGGSR